MEPDRKATIYLDCQHLVSAQKVPQPLRRLYFVFTPGENDRWDTKAMVLKGVKFDYFTKASPMLCIEQDTTKSPFQLRGHKIENGMIFSTTITF